MRCALSSRHTISVEAVSDHLQRQPSLTFTGDAPPSLRVERARPAHVLALRPLLGHAFVLCIPDGNEAGGCPEGSDRARAVLTAGLLGGEACCAAARGRTPAAPALTASADRLHCQRRSLRAAQSCGRSSQFIQFIPWGKRQWRRRSLVVERPSKGRRPNEPNRLADQQDARVPRASRYPPPGALARGRVRPRGERAARHGRVARAWRITRRRPAPSTSSRGPCASR